MMSKAFEVRLFARDLRRWATKRLHPRRAARRHDWVESPDETHLKLTGIAGGSR